jgi:hypothetical protein
VLLTAAQSMFSMKTTTKVLVTDGGGDGVDIDSHVTDKSNVKEVTLPIDDKLIDYLDANNVDKLYHGFYRFRGGLGLRMIPTSNMFCLTFYNDEELKQRIASRSNGKILDQTILSLSDCLQIRYDDNDTSLPYFNDYTALEGAIHDLQSPLVLGLDSSHSQSLDKKDQHCWVEVHHMIKSPSKFFK